MTEKAPPTAMPNAMAYDCEIIKAIPPRKRGEQRIPGIEYCSGRDDHANMGISVITAFDFLERRRRVFLEDNFGDFQDLVHRRDVIIGFNSKKFDDELCRAHGFDIPPDRSWDLLREIYYSLSLDPDKWNFRTHGGYGLNDVSIVNLGRGKPPNIDGAIAPVLWQQGKYGQVIDYGLTDTDLLVDLVDIVAAGKPLANPKGGGLMMISPPF